MPPLLDCYVLVPTRSAARAREFLDWFLPLRRPLADEYELPQYAESPERVFATAEELLVELEKRPGEPHALYWANLGVGEPRFAMVFPTSDGQMVFGLSVDEPEPGLDRSMLAALRQFFGERCPAYSAMEEPPPTDEMEFRRRAEKAG